MPIWYQFYQISNQLRFDSTSIRFNFIEFAPPVTYYYYSIKGLDWFDLICSTSSDVLLLLQTLIMWDACKWNRKSSSTEVQFDLIRLRFDSIRFRLDADLVPILPDFKSASILFYFNSIWFDCAPPVTFLLLLLLLLLLLFSLFHYLLSSVLVTNSNKYRTSMPLGVLSSVVVSLTIFWYHWLLII
jgi:hypothetical protein